MGIGRLMKSHDELRGRSAPLSNSQWLVERLAERIGRALECQGILARDAESSPRRARRLDHAPRRRLVGARRAHRRAAGLGDR